MPLYYLPLAVLFFTFLACKGDRQSEAAPAANIDSLALDSRIQRDFTTWNVGPHPESVTIDGAKVYVMQFGDELQPMTQDGDGYIAVYDANGRLLDTLVTGLDAPKGSEVVGNVLYVADVDTLFGFSTLNGKTAQVVSFTGKTSFLNGLTAGASGTLYVSATDSGKIWAVTAAAGVATELSSLPGVNGLSYDSATGLLYAVTFLQNDAQAGGVYLVSLDSGKTTRIGSYSGMLDGLQVFNDKLYFTDWNPAGQGRMLEMDIATGETRIVAESDLLSGPADFDILPDGIAIVPLLLDKRLAIIRL